MHSNELLRLYEEEGALLRGHFLLRSGMHSDQYLQSAILLANPSLLLAQEHGAEGGGGGLFGSGLRRCGCSLERRDTLEVGREGLGVEDWPPADTMPFSTVASSASAPSSAAPASRRIVRPAAPACDSIEKVVKTDQDPPVTM